MWTTSSSQQTAEWQCTQCDTTNRKLLPRDATHGDDRCMHCKRKHLLRIGETPVRWTAQAA